MQRICAAVHRHTKIKVIGLCHQLGAGYAMVGKALANNLAIYVPPEFTSTHASDKYAAGMHATAFQALEKIKITAAGVNHFTWMLSLRDRHTHQDLYPLFCERWQQLPENFEPLTRRMFDAFGLFPIPGDEHLCEYLPWVSDPETKPWEKYELELYEWKSHSDDRDEKWVELENAIQTRENPDSYIPFFSEGAQEVIENILLDSDFLYEAVNIPNQGQIPNLPEGAIIELPGLLNASGATGIQLEPLPEGIAELLRREITISHLTVDAVVNGDRRLARQALLLDPVIRDMDVADQILDDYLLTYRNHLPTFWNDIQLHNSKINGKNRLVKCQLRRTIMSDQITPLKSSSQPETIRFFNGPLSQYGLPSWLVYVLGIIGAIYLLNPTAGMIELIPDITPIIGNLDEGLAMVLVMAGISEAKANRKNRVAKKANLAAQENPPSPNLEM